MEPIDLNHQKIIRAAWRSGLSWWVAWAWSVAWKWKWWLSWKRNYEPD